MARSTCILCDPIRAIRHEGASLKRPRAKEIFVICMLLKASASSGSQFQLQDAVYKEQFSSHPLPLLADSYSLQPWVQVQTPEHPCHPCQNPPVQVPTGITVFGPRRLSAMEARASLILPDPNIQSRTMLMAMLGTAGYQKSRPTMAAACEGSGKELLYW